MKVVITGSTSKKLFGKDYNNKEYISVTRDIFTYFVNHPEVEEVYTSMQTGIDLLVGLAVNKFNDDFGKRIQLTCCIPSRDQTRNYSEQEKKLYDSIIEKADTVMTFSSKPYSFETLKLTTKFMVDNTDQMICYWDGNRFKSDEVFGIYYANNEDKPITIINPFNLAFRYNYREYHQYDEPQSVKEMVYEERNRNY